MGISFYMGLFRDKVFQPVGPVTAPVRHNQVNSWRPDILHDNSYYAWYVYCIYTCMYVEMAS